MKILLAIDSFKGCLSTFEAEQAAASVLVGDEVIRVPVSDGGEGFTDCWVECFGGIYRECRAKDPIGREITTRYGLLDKGKTAVIETAAASGITLLSSAERDPVKASSFGTGQLI
ncbi:MAG: glycerate kinase [Bacteroidales bacterium]|nr:glycerate kinase [Bacteroidales bacterium]